MENDTKVDNTNEVIRRTKHMLKIQSKGRLVEMVIKAHILINYYEQLVRDMQVKFNNEFDTRSHWTDFVMKNMDEKHIRELEIKFNEELDKQAPPKEEIPTKES